MTIQNLPATENITPPRGMTSRRIVALIAGCVMLLPGVALLLGGGGLGLGYAFGRDDSGYFTMNVADLHSRTAAITADSPSITNDLGTPEWLTDTLRTEVRLRITATDPQQPIFVGVGPAGAVDAYLNGVAHDNVIALTGGKPTVQAASGARVATAPAEQTFWAADSSGTGTAQLDFIAPSGRWAMVLMNADGSPVVTATATFGVNAPFLLTLAIILAALGLVITAGAIVLIVVGASGRGQRPIHTGGSVAAPQPAVIGYGIDARAIGDRAVALTAHRDLGLSRWLWLVKWILVFPHVVVLALLWPAFVVATLVAGICILFTGRYPRSLFDFTTGVLRWTCRVSYYALSGGIGTDRYPPFSLGTAPDYPVSLDIRYPAELSRGLVLVKWWLLAIPHYLIIGLLVGNWFGWTSLDGRLPAFAPVGGAGILGLLVVAAGCVLLVTGRYPTSLFDLIVGLNRWIYRVIVYVSLMTDDYPPFRLDLGGTEPIPHAPIPHAPLPPVAGGPTEVVLPVSGAAGR